MRSSHFMGGDAHDGPMDMDYFVWVAVGNARTFLIDVGFSPLAAKKRKRAFLCDPIESLKLIGVEPAQIKDVILTHLHYDHAGNFSGLPEAQFHLQETEMHFATGRHIKYRYFSAGFDVEDIINMVRLNYDGRVNFYDGRVDLAPGIILQPTPGHSAGQQAVCVHTQRGWVVLASDAAHYYENLQRHRPYPAALHVDKMLESFDHIMQMAGDIQHIIPGHDPLVMQVYPAPRPELDGIIARLDVMPKELPPRPIRKPT
ncbi:Glyoxylase, beta-lactamase superfamily II [Pollutimonas bauzanensis]|uniref:Glyoxylase, beta-lactamase superfamily II n=2 Tax=Pollutimonas bauzanensis TaxID=658167 RepID=A0A1M5X683_9BURK|nr:Glyoxylase, beta-lactamase superfamily II [Pollutimonas bauzanensis]